MISQSAIVLLMVQEHVNFVWLHIQCRRCGRCGNSAWERPTRLPCVTTVDVSVPDAAVVGAA